MSPQTTAPISTIPAIEIRETGGPDVLTSGPWQKPTVSSEVDPTDRSQP